MKSNKFLLVGFLIASLGCSQTNQIGGSLGLSLDSPQNGLSLPAMTGANVLPITVDGSSCSAANLYPNKPCVSVTICSTTAGNTNCQTIDDLLVDTGSSGLRIFKSVLNANMSFTPVTSGANTVTTCADFLTGGDSALWGPVENVNITLGGEPAISVPAEIVDPTYSNPSDYCGDLAMTPSEAGYNGILGVGLSVQDCGIDCPSGNYFSCNGSACSDLNPSLAQELANPVAMLPQDNNGIVFELPLINLGGVSSSSGYVILGIGTRTNNTPSGVSTFYADPVSQDFGTNFQGTTYSGSFLDTGSNALYFQSPLPQCTSADDAGFFCPSSVVNLTAAPISSSTSTSVIIPFQVGNAGVLIPTTDLPTTNNVFIELSGSDGGTTLSDEYFDWGLPFFIGRNVYVGFEGRSSALGTGPYWAF